MLAIFQYFLEGICATIPPIIYIKEQLKDPLEWFALVALYFKSAKSESLFLKEQQVRREKERRAKEWRAKEQRAIESKERKKKSWESLLDTTENSQFSVQTFPHKQQVSPDCGFLELAICKKAAEKYPLIYVRVEWFLRKQTGTGQVVPNRLRTPNPKFHFLVMLLFNLGQSLRKYQGWEFAH